MNHDEFQVLIGSMLGDGHLQINNGCKNAVFVEAHKKDDADYLRWKATILQKYYPRLSYSLSSNIFYLCTRIHPELTEIQKRWYPSGKGKKQLVMDDVKKLDEMGLAVWYQDDGNFKWDHRLCGISSGFEIEKLRKTCAFIKEKWGLSFKIYPRAQRLYLNRADSEKFLSIISSFIHPCMVRKTMSSQNISKYKKQLEKELIVRRKKYPAKNRQIRGRWHSDPEFRERRLISARNWKNRNKDNFLEYGLAHNPGHRR